MSSLDPRLLLQGYASGIFPMADSRDADELFWVEPRNRDNACRENDVSDVKSLFNFLNRLCE